MRRHSDNTEKGNSGILVLFAMWVLALMALSTAANAEDHEGTPTVRTQDRGAEVQVTNSQIATEGSQRQISVAPSKKQKSSEAPATQPESSEPVTLTRFVLISIPDRQLALVDNGEVVKIYPIAVGATHTPSPQGNFTIVRRVSNPTWSHKGKVVEPGKNNPVGSRWMGLSLKGYGIHGTNAPRSIGKAASHGCFRMGKKDVEELFTLVKVGDTVAVRAQRDELVSQVFGPASNGTQSQVASTALTASATEDEE